MTFGDIVFTQFPFTTGAETKKRPALVILDPDDGDIVVARISSQPFESAFEVAIANWSDAGLRLPSWARLHKLYTLHKSSIDRQIGKLSPADLNAVKGKLEEMVESL